MSSESKNLTNEISDSSASFCSVNKENLCTFISDFKKIDYKTLIDAINKFEKLLKPHSSHSKYFKLINEVKEHKFYARKESIKFYLIKKLFTDKISEYQKLKAENKDNKQNSDDLFLHLQIERDSLVKKSDAANEWSLESIKKLAKIHKESLRLYLELYRSVDKFKTIQDDLIQTLSKPIRDYAAFRVKNSQQMQEFKNELIQIAKNEATFTPKKSPTISYLIANNSNKTDSLLIFEENERKIQQLEMKRLREPVLIPTPTQSRTSSSAANSTPSELNSGSDNEQQLPEHENVFLDNYKSNRELNPNDAQPEQELNDSKNDHKALGYFIEMTSQNRPSWPSKKRGSSSSSNLQINSLEKPKCNPERCYFGAAEEASKTVKTKPLFPLFPVLYRNQMAPESSSVKKQLPTINSAIFNPACSVKSNCSSSFSPRSSRSTSQTNSSVISSSSSSRDRNRSTSRSSVTNNTYNSSTTSSKNKERIKTSRPVIPLPIPIPQPTKRRPAKKDDFFNSDDEFNLKEIKCSNKAAFNSFSGSKLTAIETPSVNPGLIQLDEAKIGFNVRVEDKCHAKFICNRFIPVYVEKNGRVTLEFKLDDLNANDQIDKIDLRLNSSRDKIKLTKIHPCISFLNEEAQLKDLNDFLDAKIAFDMKTYLKNVADNDLAVNIVNNPNSNLLNVELAEYSYLAQLDLPLLLNGKILTRENKHNPENALDILIRVDFSLNGLVDELNDIFFELMLPLEVKFDVKTNSDDLTVENCIRLDKESVKTTPSLIDTDFRDDTCMIRVKLDSVRTNSEKNNYVAFKFTIKSSSEHNLEQLKLATLVDNKQEWCSAVQMFFQPVNARFFIPQRNSSHLNLEVLEPASSKLQIVSEKYSIAFDDYKYFHESISDNYIELN